MGRKIKLLTLFFLFAFKAESTHIVGGDFTYRWISGNNFELTLKIYRDCFTSQTTFDDSIVVGIFDKVTNLRTGTLKMSISDSSYVTLSGSSNCTLPPDVCVIEGTYTKSIILPDNPNGYYIAWERCCRNSSIVNISDPLSTGMTFYLEMPDPSLHNSSPEFSFDPLPFICEGQPLNYSFAVTDIDGDQVVYELVDPLAGNSGPSNPIPVNPVPGPYAPVIWNPGYDLNNVCASSINPLAINAITGSVSVTVDYSGIYAAAIVVHEFRGGVEIGLIRREIEFSVIICANYPPVLNFTSALPFSANNYTIYESDSVCFNATATDASDSVFMKFSGEVFSGGSIMPPYAIVNNDSGLTVAHSGFCWGTTCGQARTAPYKIAYSISDNGCPLPATVTDTISITVQTAPVFNGLALRCIGLRNNLSTEVFWNDSSGVPSRLFDHYDIYKSKNGSPFTLLGTVNDLSVGSFPDSTAVNYLTDDYCYFIKGVNTCGVTGPPSDTLCTISQFNDKINYLKQASVIDSGKIEIQWKHFPEGVNSTFYIYRKENSPGALFTIRKTLYQPNYDSWIDDEAATSEKSYCYYMTNEDYCGNVSPNSNESCSILLKGFNGSYESDLNWTPYSTWNGGVKQYEIFRKPVESSSYSILSNQPDSVIYFRDFDLDLNSGQFNYYVKAVEGTGSLYGESFSNEITLSQPPVAFLPAAFTPDGNYLNDVWGVSSAFVKTIDLKVFSRWGTLIFYSTDKKLLWDGTFKGKKATQGTYVYTLRYTGFQNMRETVKTGTVTLIR